MLIDFMPRNPAYSKETVIAGLVIVCLVLILRQLGIFF